MPARAPLCRGNAGAGHASISTMFGIPSKVESDEGKIDELLSRGVAEALPSKESLKTLLMSGKRLRIKLGIDPTGANLHIGNSVPLLKLRSFQELGHTVVLIVGDFTATIGDTSDKESERPMLSRAAIAENMKTYKEQVGKILDLSKTEFRRNSAWLGTLTYQEIGEHADIFSVSDFIARDAISRRLKGGKRVSLREVLYPLMQGYDSVAVKADVELGGADQRFNLLAGRALQEHFGQVPQHILTFALVTDGAGKKVSKTGAATVYLTDTPDTMFGKTMSVPDELVEQYFISMTRKPIDEVRALLAGHPRDAKLALAYELVEMYHSKEKAENAKESFIQTFSNKQTPDTMPLRVVQRNTTYLDALSDSGLVASKNEARRLFAEGAVSSMLTNTVIGDPEAILTQPDKLKIGKKRFLEIKIDT